MTEVRALAGDAVVEDFGYRPAPPGVRANMIFSADGAAAFHGRAGPLSCPADQRLLLALRAYADVVLVGAGTARAEHYGPVRLSAEHQAHRRELGLTEPAPPIAVVSQSGQLPHTMFETPTPPILITSARGAREMVGESRCRIIISGEDTVDVADAIGQLRERGGDRILCEGGPTLLDELVAADLVDELCATLSPRLAGSQPLGRGAPAGMSTPTELRLDQVLVSDSGFLYLRYGRA
ncbi:MAG: pyrimidine reductase family protein [Mycobacterium sp.]|nr:pyrimidine reductase family protein [Mycobacterium sp.]